MEGLGSLHLAFLATHCSSSRMLRLTDSLSLCSVSVLDALVSAVISLAIPSLAPSLHALDGLSSLVQVTLFIVN